MEKEFDVMLSYQWDHQASVKKMKEYLENQQLKVWMDLSEMSGDINKAMAKAVEESKIVILCLSKKYENSHNCIKEYSLVDKKRKPFIAIKMETFEFEPGSALEAILGNQMYYDMKSGYDGNVMKKVYNAISKETGLLSVNVL